MYKYIEREQPTPPVGLEMEVMTSPADPDAPINEALWQVSCFQNWMQGMINKPGEVTGEDLKDLLFRNVNRSNFLEQLKLISDSHPEGLSNFQINLTAVLTKWLFLVDANDGFPAVAGEINLQRRVGQILLTKAFWTWPRSNEVNPSGILMPNKPEGIITSMLSFYDSQQPSRFPRLPDLIAVISPWGSFLEYLEDQPIGKEANPKGMLEVAKVLTQSDNLRSPAVARLINPTLSYEAKVRIIKKSLSRGELSHNQAGNAQIILQELAFLGSCLERNQIVPPEGIEPSSQV